MDEFLQDEWLRDVTIMVTTWMLALVVASGILLAFRDAFLSL